MGISLEGKKNSRVDSKDYEGNGHWYFPEPLGGKEYVGFVYAIVNTKDDKFYIGKKTYRSKGKLTKGKESNWRWYISSSKSLSEEIKELEKADFLFVVLEQYKTLGGLSWAETWSLCHVETPTNNRSYNRLINKVSWRSKETITNRHKERLKGIINV